MRSREIKLFDLHADTVSRLMAEGGNLRKNHCHLDIEKLSGYKKTAQFYALWGDCPPDKYAKSDCRRLLDALYGTAVSLFAAERARICRCDSSEGLEVALNAGKHAAFLSIEGAELLGGSDYLQVMYDRGVRMLTLTWNYDNDFAGCSASGSNLGLTAEGRRLVRDASALGVLVDLSHASEKTFFDVCDQTDVLLLASHSNAYAVCPHSRNLTDMQITEIIRRGGLCGINLYAEFLKTGGNCGIEDIISHIEHILSLGGEKILSLGCDFDGCERLPDGVANAGGLWRLYDAMLKRGICAKTANRIFYCNAAEYIKKYL